MFIIHPEKYSVKISFSLRLACQKTQGLSSPLIPARVSEPPLSFYYLVLVYFQDYRTGVFLCQCILPSQYHHIGCSFHSNRTRYHRFPRPCARAEVHFSAKPKFTGPCLVEWVWALSFTHTPRHSSLTGGFVSPEQFSTRCHLFLWI